MINNPLEQYSEYRIRNIVSRLELFRNSIGWGQLSDDLEVAIDALECLIDSMKEPVPTTQESGKPRWIVTDYGFAGRYSKCSECDEGHWDLVDYGDECPRCHAHLDPNETEYTN